MPSLRLSLWSAALLVIWTLTTSCQGCNETLTDPIGVITSPGFPDPYPPSISCWWRIGAPTGQIILLNFTNLNIECGYDVVRLYDGYNSSADLIGEFCYLEQDMFFASTSNWVYVTFDQDESETKDGFSMTYSFYNCDIKLTESNCTFSSPNYPGNYPNNLRCSWTIVSEEGRNIVLIFDQVFTECLYDYVNVYDGTNQVGEICGGKNIRINSKGNALRVLFESDLTITYSGFTAHYYFTDPTDPLE